MLTSTQGPSALSARRLATQSGTTTAAIYTLFGGMNSLRAALTAQSLTGLGEALRAVPENPDHAQLLREQARAYREWAIAHPHEYRAVFTDALGQAVRGTMEPPRTEQSEQDELESFTAPGAYLDSVHDAWHSMLVPFTDTLRNGLTSGAFRGEVERAGALALTVLSQLHGALSLELVGVLDTTLAALGSSASAPAFYDAAVNRLVVGLVQGGAEVPSA